MYMRLKALEFLSLFLIAPTVFAQTQTNRLNTRGTSIFDALTNRTTILISGATPSVARGNVFKTNNAVPTTMRNFLGGAESQRIVVNCGDTNTTIQNNANIVGASATDIVCSLNTAFEFVYDAAQSKWVQSLSGGGGSGSTGGANNSTQKNGGGSLSGSTITDSGSLVTVGADSDFKGPNPYIDVRAYGVRATSTAPSTTGTIKSGSATMTLAVASAFINGDGIVVRGAGKTNPLLTPAAPRVSPSNAAALTGTGIVVTNTSGATTYQYQIVARTTGGAYTAASTATSISNGPATLGSSSVSISSWTASGTTITVNTSAAHNLVTFAMVLIQGAGGANGWWRVTVKSSTQFTFETTQDTALGAPTSGGAAGTVQWWNCNHISWTGVSGAYEYFIYGRSAGSMNLIGISLPNSMAFGRAITNDPTANTFDDFGATMTANISSANVPDWVPLTPPAAAKNNDLVTTIVSGGGTTKLTLAAAASNSVVSATTKFDNAPNIIAAASASTANKTNQVGVLYFPSNGNINTLYVTNSYMNLGQFPNILSVAQAGTIALGDTMQLGGTQWSGSFMRYPASASNFQLWKMPQIVTSTAFPMIYSSRSAVKLDFATLTHNSPQGVIWVNDELGAIPGLELDHVNFSHAGSDYMSMAFVVRGDANSGGNITLRHVGDNGGGLANSLGITATPYFYFIQCGDPSEWADFSMARRGIFYYAASGGGPGFGGVVMRRMYIQGGVTPLVTGYFSGGSISFNVRLDVVVLDTTSAPQVTWFGTPRGTVTLGQGTPGAGQPSFNGPPKTMFVNFGGTDGAGIATRDAFVTNGISTAASTVQSPAGGVYSAAIFNAGLSVGPTYEAFVQPNRMAAPTCVVSAGGAVTIGRHVFQVNAAFPSGGLGELSMTSTACVTSPKNQTITISWAAMPGATGYNIYDNGISFACRGPWVTPGSATSYVWTSAAPCNAPRPTIAGAGPVGMNINRLWAPQLRLSAADLGGYGTLLSPSLTANRTWNLPDLTGTAMLAPVIANNEAGPVQPGHTLVGDAHTAGTVVDSGVQMMAVYDNFHYVNGSLPAGNPNWTLVASTINITSNTVKGATAGAHSMAVYTGVSFPSADQTAIITLASTGGVNNADRVVVRGSATANTAYFCSWANTTTTVDVAKIVAGTSTVLATFTLPALPVSNDTIGINVTGTTITCYFNGLRLGSATDSSIATGYPGIGFFSSGAGPVASFAASFGSVSLGMAQTWSALQTMAGGLNMSAQTASTDACLDGSKNLISGAECNSITRTLSNASTSAGPLTGTVASGAVALGTSAIASGACASVITATATGTLTTDVIQANFNTDVSAVPGYSPSASGSLYIRSYPTPNNVNFLVCNSTAGSITPGAATLNWRVER